MYLQNSSNNYLKSFTHSTDRYELLPPRPRNTVSGNHSALLVVLEVPLELLNIQLRKKGDERNRGLRQGRKELADERFRLPGRQEAVRDAQPGARRKADILSDQGKLRQLAVQEVRRLFSLAWHCARSSPVRCRTYAGVAMRRYSNAKRCPRTVSAIRGAEFAERHKNQACAGNFTQWCKTRCKSAGWTGLL